MQRRGERREEREHMDEDGSGANSGLKERLKKNAVRVSVKGAGENLRGGTNRLREIIKKNDGKRLDKMRNKREREPARGRDKETEEEKERESVLNDHFSISEAVIWLASGLQVM